jgi:Tfp pilus assembly protein PilV
MTTLYSRYILPVLAIVLMQSVNAQQTKAVNNRAKATLSKQKITEQLAKRINEAQLAREGKTGTRRAYKRSDIEKILHTEQDSWVGAVENEETEHAAKTAHVIEKKQMAIKKEPAAIAKNIPREPKFIEGIVLERN